MVESVSRTCAIALRTEYRNVSNLVRCPVRVDQLRRPLSDEACPLPRAHPTVFGSIRKALIFILDPTVTQTSFYPFSPGFLGSFAE
jgi:hypothetical protein